MLIPANGDKLISGFAPYTGPENLDGWEIKPVHITTIRTSDIVLIGGRLKTVGQRDIRECPFMGKTLFGSNHMGGLEPVMKAFPKKPA